MPGFGLDQLRAGSQPGLAHLLGEAAARAVASRGNPAHALDLRDVLDEGPTAGLGPDQAFGLEQGDRLPGGALGGTEPLDQLRSEGIGAPGWSSPDLIESASSAAICDAVSGIPTSGSF